MASRVEDGPTSTSKLPSTEGGHWLDQFNPTLVKVVTVLGFAVPVGVYLWFIDHYGVDVILHDQWSDIDIIRRSYDGTLNLGSLWALHNENRMLVPRLIVLLLSRVTHLNILSEEYLAAAMLIAGIGLIIWAHHRRQPSTPLLYYCPIALLMLSLAQYENTLWGFQMAWYLVLLAFAASIALLDRRSLTSPVLVGAIAVAIVGSFSSLQGLLIWPVGFILLYHRRRPRRIHLIWLGSAIGTSAVYFWGFHYSDPYAESPFRHPLAAFKFFSFALGDVVGVDLPGFESKSNPAVLALGIFILVAAIAVIVLYGIRRDPSGGGPIGVALVAFGVLFAATITQGRIRGGFYYASEPRYRTYDLLIVVGCYLALLARPSLHPPVLNAGPKDGGGSSVERTMADRAAVAVRALIAVIIGAQVLIGTSTGLKGAKNYSALQRLDARALASFGKSPVALTQAFNGNLSATMFEQLVPFARAHRLSLFGSGQLAMYVREGPPGDYGRPITKLLDPKSGSTISGIKELVIASASDALGVTRVEFRLSGGLLTDVRIGTGYNGVYGWFMYWNTTTIPNGTYTLQSVAYGAAGDQGRSHPTTVVVDNT